jgi:hypothetical protein
MAAREREHITRAGHAADEETVVVDGAAYGRMLERAARVGLVLLEAEPAAEPAAEPVVAE